MNIFSADSRSPICVNRQLVAWQVVTAARTSRNRHSIVKKMPLSFYWHTEKESLLSFIVNRSNLHVSKCRNGLQSQQTNQEGIRENGLQIQDVFSPSLKSTRSVSLPIFPTLKNMRQMPALKIHITLTPETNAMWKMKRRLRFIVHLKVMQIKKHEALALAVALQAVLHL